MSRPSFVRAVLVCLVVLLGLTVATSMASGSDVRAGVTVRDVDSDGDGLMDPVDCAPDDATRPDQEDGEDTNCDGVVNEDDTPAGTPTEGDDSYTGTAGADAWSGAGGNDDATGGDGDDTLHGDAGNDTLAGDAGADSLLGGVGNDTLDGGLGADVLNGQAGNDVMRGGAGNDTIMCSAGRLDKAFGQAGNDKLTCQDRVGGDVIDGGAGRDTCIGDKKDVFRGCEQVVRK